VVDSDVVRAAAVASLNAGDYLARNDAYAFFQKCGGLFVTGPTQTNVCDLRIVLVEK
jgi:glycerate-2-kinase